MASVNASNANASCAKERIRAARKNRLFRKSQSAIFILNLVCICFSELLSNLAAVNVLLAISFLLSLMLFVRESRFAKENHH